MQLPQFNQLNTKTLVTQLDTMLSASRNFIEAQLKANTKYTWENLIQPLEEDQDAIDRFWSIVSHLHAVKNSADLRKAYKACLPKISEYSNWLGQHEVLYQAYLSIKERESFNNLSMAKQKVISQSLQDFQLSGVALIGEKKKRFAEIQILLSDLSNQFEEHVLDASNHWQRQVLDEKDLAGLPAIIKEKARERANLKKIAGFLLGLDMPCYFAVMRHAQNRLLRQECYQAFVSKASDVGPQAGYWDNSNIMNEILRLRQEKAQLLGFANYAEYSLAKKMVKTPDQVINFLHELCDKSINQAKKELQDLKVLAKEDGIDNFEPWDQAYYSERLKEKRFSVNEELLRAYFPESVVFNGLFQISEKLYGINISQVTETFDSWHQDVKLFSVYRDDNLIGYFYMDLYARDQKRSGAWMGEYCTRRLQNDGSVQLPIAYLVCNLTAPTSSRPALFTHDEVVTLFHEFGHTLHHLLTEIDYASVSGINGVLWDAVEFPSQLMEYWAYEEEVMALISEHYQTKETLPHDILIKLKASKNFQSGMQMMRQIDFSLFDFNVHLNSDETKSVQSILDAVRKKTALLPSTSYNRFQHSFSHIFAGGYAAGYYSYKWAEVLSADAFSLFKNEGVFSRKLGKKLQANFLSQGGVVDPEEAFIAFRGRKPEVQALLTEEGIQV